MKLFSRILAAVFFSITPFLFGAGIAETETFPAHPVTILVPYARGGGTDYVARSIAGVGEKYLGQVICVNNILGSSGAAGMVEGAAAIPDGYTVTMITRELVSLPAVGVADITKDDFQLLCLLNTDPAVLVVPRDSSMDSVKTLVDEARENPGKLRFASAAKPHFYILDFERKLNINFNKIPYNGAAPAIQAMIDGRADFGLVNPGELKPWLESKEVRCIAIMDKKRSVFLPEVPTFLEQGYDVTSYTWRGLAVPAGTPAAVRNKLEDTFASAAKDPAFAQVLSQGYYTAAFLNSEDFSLFIDEDWQVVSGYVW
ncbi:tripartite tricarboxylate transporter substrate binding protein [Marispirochaeta sp.]|jgi:tripartite-type tricarboxylate transporter receptor subunit TctC|uniref:tripartite tricarboxylate transporter substrate binding protein n=1 Tax=Marispirochaeta sp. TaxID=2038653 RepID=UPI0029C7BE70|nr:tripartite tricarboxylate transporter substrate binding protein [Marispirochaeta sp.]